MQKSDMHSYILLSKNSGEYIPLGAHVDGKYFGPEVDWGKKRYRLSDETLDLLMDRFRERNAQDSVVFITRYALLEMMDDDSEWEPRFSRVSGTSIADVPLSKYLPEMIEDPNFEKQLVRIRRTRTGQQIGMTYNEETGKWTPPQTLPEGWRYNSDRGLWEEDS